MKKRKMSYFYIPSPPCKNTLYILKEFNFKFNFILSVKKKNSESPYYELEKKMSLTSNQLVGNAVIGPIESDCDTVLR